jgi:hypothetical protein
VTPLPSSIRIGVHESGEQPWIEWAGGECPVSAETQVDVVLGVDKPELHHGLADHYEWSHDASVKRYDAQITAYRVVQA